MRRARLVALALASLATILVLAAPAAGERAVAARERTLDRQVLAQLNAVRRQHGLRTLTISRRLNAAADSHSLEMAYDGYFDHASRNGTVFWKRLERYYPVAGYRKWKVGENLVWQSPELTASEAVKLWMDSPPHRKNMLDRDWREVGISAVRVESGSGPFQGLTVILVTLDFGARTR